LAALSHRLIIGFFLNIGYISIPLRE